LTPKPSWKLLPNFKKKEPKPIKKILIKTVFQASSPSPNNNQYQRQKTTTVDVSEGFAIDPKRIACFCSDGASVFTWWKSGVSRVS
jgi:hypothetical protein